MITGHKETVIGVNPQRIWLRFPRAAGFRLTLPRPLTRSRGKFGKSVCDSVLKFWVMGAA